MLRRLPVLAVCLALSACARLPDVAHLQAPPDAHPSPTVINAQGALSSRESRRLLVRRLGHTRLDATALAGLEEAATGRPLIAGNKVTLLFDGPRTITAMMAAVAAARDTIHLETYIFDQDPLGLKFADLLVAKQREGVQVCIIYDCVGTLGTPEGFFDRMREAGIRLLPFHPVSPLRRFGRWRLNNRDHRKILVVDGKVAFTGGVNITKAYARSSPFRSKRADPRGVGWRDTHLQIEGPAVAALQWMFLDTWASQDGGALPERDFFPALPPAGDKVLRVLGSWPQGEQEIYKATILAIQGATRSIHITVAYFVPPPQVLRALLEAARRGVDVQIILPSVSDSGPVFHAGRSFYAPMLKAGIQVHELRSAVLHAKTAVIDGSWSTVGSTNLDTRSFLHNREVNVVVMGDGFGQEMEGAFRDDRQDSDRITLEPWNRRPLGQRIKEWFARRIAYWL
jgi:cardiolipin synthase